MSPVQPETNATEGTKVTPSAQQVKQLRELTGAGWMDCKAALEANGGNVEQAVDWLRKKGMASAQRKAGRATSEGCVASYIHAGSKIGVMLELNCETDFVARTEEFRRLAHDLAMHVAAAEPRFIRREDVAADLVAREKEIYRAQVIASGKPEKVADKIVEGKLEKFFEENCLYEQHFIKDDKHTIKELIDSAIARIKENITVRRFVRFKLGDSVLLAESKPAE